MVRHILCKCTAVTVALVFSLTGCRIYSGQSRYENAVNQDVSDNASETAFIDAADTAAEQRASGDVNDGSFDSIFAMDTIIEMHVYGGDEAEALARGRALIKHLDDLWSATDDGSDVYRMNHAVGEPVDIDEETKRLLDYSIDIADETDGAFNPALYPLIRAWGFPTREYRIPYPEEISELLRHTDYRKVKLDGQTAVLPEGTEIEFGAVAKGYTGDMLKETLMRNGVTSAVINLGGNVALIGDSPDGDPWKVEIRSPYGEGNFGSLSASDCHIITSGGYERYFTDENGQVYWHILDPETGYPAESGIISATIVGKDGKMCDALSTAVFVMGLDKAEEYWRTHDGFDMLLVSDDGEIYLTDGIEHSFEQSELSQGAEVHVIRK